MGGNHEPGTVLMFPTVPISPSLTKVPASSLALLVRKQAQRSWITGPKLHS